MIIIKSFQELTNKEVYELLKLRFKVFVMEQGCHDLDPDGIDYSAIHIFIKNDDESMAHVSACFQRKNRACGI